MTLCYTKIMKKLIRAFFDNEILSYLFFGGATTLISIVSRLLIYHISHQEILATALANIIGILFAFITNDIFVFKLQTPCSIQDHLSPIRVLYHRD